MSIVGFLLTGIAASRSIFCSHGNHATCSGPTSGVECKTQIDLDEGANDGAEISSTLDRYCRHLGFPER